MAGQKPSEAMDLEGHNTTGPSSISSLFDNLCAPEGLINFLLKCWYHVGSIFREMHGFAFLASFRTGHHPSYQNSATPARDGQRPSCQDWYYPFVIATHS